MLRALRHPRRLRGKYLLWEILDWKLMQVCHTRHRKNLTKCLFQPGLWKVHRLTLNMTPRQYKLLWMCKLCLSTTSNATHP